MQLQVINSPFKQEQVEALNRLLPTLTEAQRVWLSGYLTGLQNASTSLSMPSEAVNAISREVTILYGSQTGNSQRLASKFTKRLEEKGYHVTLSSMSDFKPNTLKKVSTLLVIVSTHGEGDPPDNALPFYEFLYSKRAPKLEDLRYSVLALGDRSYEYFCQTGKDFDGRLEELGGQRLSPRVDCDVDFEESGDEWYEGVIRALDVEIQTSSTAVATVIGDMAALQTEYSRSNPFHAEVLENINLNGRGSSRETRHIEISLEGSNLQYEPGDCIGIYPENHPELVDALITAMEWNSEQFVPVNKKGEERPLREALLRHYEITVLTMPLLEEVASIASAAGLDELLKSGNEDKLREYIKGRDLLDLVQDFALRGAGVSEWIPHLRKMPPRLYSIASSLKANPNEAHVTVRAVRYEAHGRNRYGVCSVHCAERLQLGDHVPIFIQHNPNFKLPSNPDTPMIMIGPGTGVAPFRAFLEEWEEIGAKGKTWLFYGDQHFLTDFLYQLDWQKWFKAGVLTRMDVAFSRDTDQKVYVQHRMLEQSRELYRWLEEGAHVYVCGDEKHMAHDVHAALAAILQQEGEMSADKAQAYLAEMQKQKRYQRDVY